MATWMERLGAIVPGRRLENAARTAPLRLSASAPVDGQALPSIAGFRERGFVEAGSFSVAGRSLAVTLLIKPDEAMLAAVFQPVGAMPWIELISHYADGEVLSFTAAARGSESRPGRPIVIAARFQPGALYARFRAERRRDGLLPVDAGSAVAILEKR
jgi:hypothetical protein